MLQVRHEINCINRTLTLTKNTFIAPFTNIANINYSDESFVVDLSNYSSTVSVYLEIYGNNANTTTAFQVSLTNCAGGTIYGPTIPARTNGAAKVFRAQILNFTGSTGPTSLYIPNGQNVNTSALSIVAARIIILQQDDNYITDSATQFDIGGNIKTSGTYTSPQYWSYNAANWDGNISCRLDATIGVSGNTSAATVSLEMDDSTYNNWTTVVSATQTPTPLPTYIGTGYFTPIDGRHYRVRVDGGTYTLYNARLVVIQNNPTGIKRLEEQYYVAGKQIGTTTGLQTVSETWTSSEWKNVVNSYYHLVDSLGGGTIDLASNIGNLAPDQINMNSYDNNCLDVQFDPTGTLFYVLGSNSRTIYQFTASRPFLSFNSGTAQYNGINFVINEDTQPLNMYVSPDGTKLYVAGGATKTTYEYNLAMAWDISSAAYSGVSFNSGAVVSGCSVNFISKDGTKAFGYTWMNKNVYAFNLSTPWDISTASYSGETITTNNTAISGLYVAPDGNNLYFFENTTSKGIYQYALNTPWVVSGATLVSTFNTTHSGAAGLDISPDGRTIYAICSGFTFGGDNLLVYTAGRPWSLSTVSATFYYFGYTTNPSGQILTYIPDMPFDGAVSTDIISNPSNNIKTSKIHVVCDLGNYTTAVNTDSVAVLVNYS